MGTVFFASPRLQLTHAICCYVTRQTLCKHVARGHQCVVTELILSHFWVRPFCVVVSFLLCNWRSHVRISELTGHFNWPWGCQERIHVAICVDKYFITAYGVFCGINAGLFNWTGLCTGHSTVINWITPTQVSSLQKGEECSDGGYSYALLCRGIVFTLESDVPGSNLRTDWALGTLNVTLSSIGVQQHTMLVTTWTQICHCTKRMVVTIMPVSFVATPT